MCVQAIDVQPTHQYTVLIISTHVSTQQYSSVHICTHSSQHVYDAHPLINIHQDTQVHVSAHQHTHISTHIKAHINILQCVIARFVLHLILNHNHIHQYAQVRISMQISALINTY